MRNSLFIFALCAFISSGHAQKIKWLSWDEGYTLAVKENKPLLVFVYSPLCNLSKRMLDKTYSNKDLSEVITGNYIAVKFDCDKAITITDGVGTLDIKQFKGSDVLKKVIGGPALQIPKTVLCSTGFEKMNPIEGVLPADELSVNLTEFLK